MEKGLQNIIITIIFVLIGLLFVNIEGEILYSFLQNNRVNQFKTISLLVKYFILGFVIFQIVKGIVLSEKKTILRNIIILLVTNVVLYSVMFFTSPNVSIDQIFDSEAIIYFFGYSVFSLFAGFINTGIFNEYKKEYKKTKHPSDIIGKYFLRAVFFTQLLYFVFVKFVNQLLPKAIFYNQTYNYILVGFITSILLGVFYILERKRNKLQKEIVKESTKAETATANFETLKNQLDPHFLFNSLNVLTGLIEENPDKAIDFTTSLSKIYRYVLEQKSKEVIPIEEEISFAKTYVNLLKLRFENSIHFELNVNSLSEEEYIVPLSLQILLENAIKHNVVSEQKPLNIKIYREDNFLIIENSLQIKDSFKDSTGVGLKNIINRYRLISNKEVNIEKNETYFRVQLPILTSRINTMENINYNENDDYQIAKQKAAELKKFYKVLMESAMTVFICVTINIITGGYWWCLWVVFGVGIRIIGKATKLYTLDDNWEKRKAQEILEKNNQSKKWK
ncbi:histidine kinase [Chishuiella changwenlii]|uniref:histidine kinase n=1 Tax=Chishuiella changwenlii TaxID=1434701 RepID=UPI002FD997F6